MLEHALQFKIDSIRREYVAAIKRAVVEHYDRQYGRQGWRVDVDVSIEPKIKLSMVPPREPLVNLLPFAPAIRR